DLDAAYAELDARYIAGEAAPYAGAAVMAQRYVELVAKRDWDGFNSQVSETIVEDHRRLGWGILGSRDEYVQMLRAIVDLAPDATLRFDHVLALNHRAVLAIGTWRGTRDGGPFELGGICIAAFAPDGRIGRIRFYDLDELDAARACFDVWTAERPAWR